METSPQSLINAIDKLYEVFAHYPLPEKFHPRDRKPQPLRLLDREALDKICEDDFLSWRPQAHFKHFLPRFLEFIISDSHVYWYDSVYRTLGWLNHQQWDLPEKIAIENYLFAHFQYILADYPSPTEPIAEYLGLLSTAVLDLTPYLVIWTQQLSLTPALRHLADLINTGYSWDTTVKGTKQLEQWTQQPLIIEALENAYFGFQDETFADEFAHAFDELTVIHALWNRDQLADG